MQPLPSDHLGSVLVIGGCGFVGFHIVRHLLLEPSCTSISVISRNPQKNRHPNVSYYAGDISDLASVRTRITQIQPTVIIHTASPLATSAGAKAFEDITVQGTRNLLSIASELASIKAFIFTSSATMAAGREHIDLDESSELADTSPSSHPYAKTKAKADKMVLDANRCSEINMSGLRTSCIRLPIVYGERDLVSIPGALAALEKGQTNFQLGDGSNLWDFVSVDNAAAAHVLLAKALLRADGTRPKVAGEAFNITDGQRHRFWDFPHVIWKAAGHDTKNDHVRVLPTWLALVVAEVLEWTYLIFTLGTKRPSLLGRQQVEYSCFTHTYSIKKAKERLGYMPVPEFEEGIRRAVEWLLTNEGWSSRLKKVE